jgi:hypothetical protein
MNGLSLNGKNETYLCILKIRRLPYKTWADAVLRGKVTYPSIGISEIYLITFKTLKLKWYA